MHFSAIALNQVHYFVIGTTVNITSRKLPFGPSAPFSFLFFFFYLPAWDLLESSDTVTAPAAEVSSLDSRGWARCSCYSNSSKFHGVGQLITMPLLVLAAVSTCYY